MSPGAGSLPFLCNWDPVIAHFASAAEIRYSGPTDVPPLMVFNSQHDPFPELSSRKVTPTHPDVPAQELMHARMFAVVWVKLPTNNCAAVPYPKLHLTSKERPVLATYGLGTSEHPTGGV